MKSIPIALQAHYDTGCTTTCELVRIECKDGTVLGMTTLDSDVVYDDGDGPVTYRADNGFRPSRSQQSADLDVDNAELQGWIGTDGVTEQQVRAGLFDYAKFRHYRVNYLDLAAGHEIRGAGTLGETKFSAHGFTIEQRSLTQQLKQTISQLYSRTCRATFGDAKCGRAFAWVSGTVTAADGTEPDRVFTCGLAQAADYFVPGVVEWLTGDNAGRQMEVDAYAPGAVTQTFSLPYPIQPGDTFRIRQDCDKTFAMCKARHANVLNFRGEHLIPQDGGASMVPGADIVRA